MADEKSTNESQGQAEGAGAVPTFLTDPVQQQLPGTPAAPAPAALNNPRADIAALNKLEMHLYAHRYAQTGISSYGSSIDPEAATADRGEAQAILEAEDKELLCSDETGRLLDRRSTMEDLLTDTQVDQVRILKRDRSRLEAETETPIPSADNPLRGRLPFWQVDSSKVAIALYDLTAGETVFEQQPTRLMIPASCMKLLTAVTALKRLGPDAVLESRLLADGTVRKDLIESKTPSEFLTILRAAEDKFL